MSMSVKPVSVISAVVWTVFSFVLPANGAERADVAALLARPGAEKARVGHTTGGDVSFLSAPAGASIAPGDVGNPADVARRFLLDNGPSFGIRSSKIDFQTERQTEDHGRTYIRLQQSYSGVPVFGGQAVVQMGKDNGIESVISGLLRHSSVLDASVQGVVPGIGRGAAAEVASKIVGEKLDVVDLKTTAGPELVVYAPEVLAPERPYLPGC